MIAWRPAAAAIDQERFEVRPLIVGHQSANQGCPPQRAALNQFAILASIGLSTRPSLKRRGDKPDFEVKGLVMTRTSPELEPLAPHIEIWCKWRCTIPGVKTDNLAVTKTRWLRKLDTSKYVRSEIALGANEKPTSGHSLPVQGCNVELTEVEMAGHAGRWWTLGYEAFGDFESAPTNVTLTVLPEKRFLLRTIGSGAFLSYPAWLRARRME